MRKILIVDDSQTARVALAEILMRRGYEVVTAETGEAAIVKARSEHPDLILMDVVMPGMNGYQATRALTRDEATRAIPIIMCTSKDQETDKIWGMRQGAMDYLVKPIEEARLLEKIDALG
ncbi:MAG: response regulator [Betaproteobacteria bacterium]|nr:response regulator [Betaproteobacteria bacterium]